MTKKTFTKNIPETELQKIKRLFPDYDNTELSAEYTTDGQIKKLVTSNEELQDIMISEGFTES